MQLGRLRRTVLAFALAVLVVACGDPFVYGVDYGCSPARGIGCDPGYVCHESWCVRICQDSFDCPGANEACIEGRCSDYSATCGGAADEPCVSQWFCDGSVCRKLLDLGQLCADDTACESNNCVDSVCCENSCSGVCESCSASATGSVNGECVVVPTGTDPDDECGLATCDGAGGCLSSALGDDCLESFECASGNCADGVCCAAPCDGVCEACSSVGACEAIPDSTDPGEECPGVAACTGSRSCYARNLGDACANDFECASGHCTDSVCCDEACLDTCQTCTGIVPGTCASLMNVSDADTCGSAVAAGLCALPPCQCDGAGQCAQAPGTLCQDETPCGGFPCLGGVCCAGNCSGVCMSCNDDDTAAGNGTCAPVSAGIDPLDDCTDPIACDGFGACFNVATGDSCDADFECTTGHCFDGVCCAVACGATCYACDGILTSALPGTCATLDDGQDPTNECTSWAACNGSGVCYNGATASDCAFGYECTGGTCVGGKCMTVVEVVAGTSHSCARFENGQVKCWGYDAEGELGLGEGTGHGVTPETMGDALSAVALGTGRTTTALSLRGTHTCALLDNGEVKCWGINNSGQLGLGDTVNRGALPGQMGDSLPSVALGTGRTATAIAVGTAHSCALLDNGQVKCWGRGDNGQLGLGNSGNRGSGVGEMGDNLPAVALGTGRTAVAIAAGQRHTCAILDNAQVKCWGYNEVGQLGLGNIEDRGDGAGEMGDSLPVVALGTGRTASAISAGTSYSCAILDNGQVKCWGAGTILGLGISDGLDNRGDGSGEMGDSLPAVALGTGRTAISIAAGGAHTCARLDNGQVKCWGSNGSGRLGLGDTSPRGTGPSQMGDNLPAVLLGTGRTATGIAPGDEHTCAVLNNGQAKCWGRNHVGQLGLGDTTNRGDGPGEMGDSLPEIDL